jgi:hypothetical protein
MNSKNSEFKAKITDKMILLVGVLKKMNSKNPDFKVKIKTKMIQNLFGILVKNPNSE